MRVRPAKFNLPVFCASVFLTGRRLLQEVLLRPLEGFTPICLCYKGLVRPRPLGLFDPVLFPPGPLPSAGPAVCPYVPRCVFE